MALLKVIAGFALLVIGGVLSLPGVPGPGIVLIFLGLVLLSDHFTWAKRTLEWARQRVEHLKGHSKPEKRRDETANRVP